jgi:hypothetical protein
MRFDLLLDEYTSAYFPFSQAPRRPARNGTEDFSWDQSAGCQPRLPRRPLFAAFCVVFVLAGHSAGAGLFGS